MCGIVGAAARRDIIPVLVEGLRRLEYRGYDSCGVAVLKGGSLARLVSVSRVAELDRQIKATNLHGETGIAHTRWATHGAPAAENAHPIVSRDGIALVHNGIIENHEELRAELQQKGYAFAGQTDTEVIAPLVSSLYADEPEWNTLALGGQKSNLADRLLWRLFPLWGKGGFLHHGQGKWYPGEQLPRWAFSCYWRKDGQPIWEDPSLFAEESRRHGFGVDHGNHAVHRHAPLQARAQVITISRRRQVVTSRPQECRHRQRRRHELHGRRRSAPTRPGTPPSSAPRPRAGRRCRGTRHGSRRGCGGPDRPASTWPVRSRRRRAAVPAAGVSGTAPPGCRRGGQTWSASRTDRRTPARSW